MNCSTLTGLSAARILENIRLVGGNAGGIWRDLRIWIDASHDGLSQAGEISKLSKHKIELIGLAFQQVDEQDGTGNRHRFRGGFIQRVKRFGHWFLEERLVDDVFFLIAH